MTSYTKTAEAVAALTSEQFRVTQQNGTERPGTGPLLKNKQAGIYVDIVSGEPLLPAPTSVSPAADGRALPNPSMPPT